jgi:starvation-inducible DNA-binding protein
MERIGIPCEPHQRRQTSEVLQEVTVDLVVLGLSATQARWHVTGPAFVPVRRQLELLGADLRRWADLVAERAVSLGTTVDGRPAAIGRAALTEFPLGFIAARDAADEISRQISDVIVHARVAVEVLGVDDVVTGHLVIEVLQGLERHLWILRSQVIDPTPVELPSVGVDRVADGGVLDHSGQRWPDLYRRPPASDDHRLRPAGA